jgi:hypothetical protein
MRQETNKWHTLEGAEDTAAEKALQQPQQQQPQQT